MKRSFITLAVLIAIMPFLGFPQSWKDIFITVAALLIIILVLIPRRVSAPREKPKRETSFVESSPNVMAHESHGNEINPVPHEEN